MTAEKIKWDWPTERKDKAAAKIRLRSVGDSVWFAEEYTVSFVLGGQVYHGWMPDYSVNVDEKWLKAIIVGDFDNGDWHVLIPEETVQSTEFLRVPRAEQDTTVVAGWW